MLVDFQLIKSVQLVASPGQDNAISPQLGLPS